MQRSIIANDYINLDGVIVYYLRLYQSAIHASHRPRTRCCSRTNQLCATTVHPPAISFANRTGVKDGLSFSKAAGTATTKEVANHDGRVSGAS